MGREYTISLEAHAFMTKCRETGREHGFTRPKTPRTKRRAKRVIGTIMEQLFEKMEFQWSLHRKNEPKKIREPV